MTKGLIAVIIILMVIVLAIATKRCLEVLILGSLLPFLFVYGPKCLSKWSSAFQQSLADNVYIVVVCSMFGGLIALLTASKGSYGFQKIISKLCNTERKTLFTTFILGLLIFVDDYLNVLTIGVCMKGVYDKRKLPREALAYMLDATGAPVCVLLPFSTWAAFYSSLFIKQDSIKAMGFHDGLAAYMSAVPYLFYPFFTLGIVVLFCAGIMPKLGGMKKAYERVRTTGMVYSEKSRRFNHDADIDEDADGNILDFLIPMGILVALAIITGDLIMSVVAALVVCFFLYIPRKVIKFDDFLNLIIKGVADILPMNILLVITFTMEAGLEKMGMTDFIIKTMEPLLSASIFPIITFILVASLTFTTGSLGGMCAIVVPIVFPLGAALGANMTLVMAAVISGGAFGSHACFYTDATLLSSQSAGIDNMEHAISQLPYVAIAAAGTVVSYGVCGFIL